MHRPILIHSAEADDPCATKLTQTDSECYYTQAVCIAGYGVQSRLFVRSSVRITKNVNGAAFARAKKIFRPMGPGKVKVNCLVVTVKIMFKWYNNVVATINIAHRNIPFVTL